MKWKYFIGIIFISYSAFGQSTADLDKKNGFREYTIGTNLSSIVEKLQFIKPLESVETKLFKAKEFVTVDGMIGDVELEFYKDRLVEITIFFQQKTIDDYNHMKQSLTQLYGTSLDESNSDRKPSYLSSYDKIVMWKGSVIGLQYNYDARHKVIEMIYWGLKETTEKIKEEF